MARATATAMISFGLVSIPVKVYVAAKANTVEFNMITPNGNRVCQKLFDSITNEEVGRADCNSGYEHIKGAPPIVFTKDEIKALEGKNDKIIEIKEFVNASEISAVSVEATYYLGPDKGGDMGYSLLSDTLHGMGKVGIAEWTIRGRDHVVAIRSHKGGLVLQQLYYADEVRDFDEVLGAKVTPNDNLRAAAAQLIQMLSTDKLDMSKYKNGFLDRIEKAIETKAAGLTVEAPKAPEKATVLDLLAALKASVASKTV